jgi:hypothetical protein
MGATFWVALTINKGGENTVNKDKPVRKFAKFRFNLKSKIKNPKSI